MTTVKTERVVETATSAIGEKAIVAKVVGLTLVSGVQEITLDTLVRVNSFVASVEKSALTSDFVKSYDIEEGTKPNQIKITVKKIQLSETNTWGAAKTTDCATDVIKIMAYGQ